MGVDWKLLGRLSNRIFYHLRSRMAVAKTGAHSILPEAYSLAKRGYALKETGNVAWAYSVP